VACYHERPDGKLVTIWKDGEGHPTRAEACPKLAVKGKGA
jgi:hypothetical protein